MTTGTATTARRHISHQPRRRFSLAELFALARQRRDLGQLDDHLLRDIGVTPDEARKEARRPLWDVPAHWRS